MASTFQIEGMTCGACVRHLVETLEALPGVVRVAVDLTRHEGRVEHKSRWVGDSALVEAAANAGYAANLVTNTPAVVERARPFCPGAKICCCG